MIKIEAAARLKAYQEKTWFDGLTSEEQKEYVQEHPHSKYAENYDNAKDAEPKDDNGDAERVSQLKKQIGYLQQDIKELKEEGEDYSRERKQLESLKGELANLQKR